MRLRAKLALTTVLFMGAILAIGGVVLYDQFRGDLYDTVDAGLASRAEAALAEGVIGENDFLLLESDEAFAQILDAQGRILESSSGLRGPLLPRSAYRPLLGVGPSPAGLETDLRGAMAAGYFDRTVMVGGESVPSRLIAATFEGPPVVIVGASVEDQKEALARLASLLFIGGPIALALVAGVGWIMAGRALLPVESMRREAAVISATDLSRRLPIDNYDDELGRLGDTLNAMLERIETAMDRERQFLDDAAHELRTPLANLKAELELALRRARTPDAMKESLSSAREETERLVRLAEDLLVLSRAAGGRLPVRREKVDLAPLVREAAANVNARAVEGGVVVRVHAEGEFPARVDAARVRQAVGNLLDNSLRHTPPGGRVSITLRRDDEMFSIEVSDSGEGFESGFLAKGFEPFSRADAGRSRPSGGTGLGLSIVRAIVDAHGGTAEVQNLPEGGASVVLSFPDSELIDGSRSSHEPEAILASPPRREDS